MFHAFDKDGRSQKATRPEWMALLARSPLQLLERAISPLQSQLTLQWLRQPETGLYMLQGRAGGTGARFNLGEVTVTRCTLRCSTPEAADSVGVAYVLGRTHRHVQLAAIADALLQTPQHHATLSQQLLEPIRSYLRAQQAERQKRAHATKVDFFTVAREAGEDDNDEEQE